MAEKSVLRLHHISNKQAHFSLSKDSINYYANNLPTSRQLNHQEYVKIRRDIF